MQRKFCRVRKYCSIPSLQKEKNSYPFFNFFGVMFLRPWSASFASFFLYTPYLQLFTQLQRNIEQPPSSSIFPVNRHRLTATGLPAMGFRLSVLLWQKRRSALVTGANRGIGFETAAKLEELGYNVLIGCREATSGAAAVTKLKNRGHTNIDCVQLDVTNEASVKKAAEVVKERFNGKLDALINNAGVFHRDPQHMMTNLEATRRCFEVNVLGAMRVTNYVLDLVKQSPAGRIVNVGSDMGSLHACRWNLAIAPYSTSKAALHMFTRNLAKSLEGTPIKVNAGHPGWVKTDMGGQRAALEVSEGAETSVYLATLPDDGPTGLLFHKKEIMNVAVSHTSPCHSYTGSWFHFPGTTRKTKYIFVVVNMKIVCIELDGMGLPSRRMDSHAILSSIRHFSLYISSLLFSINQSIYIKPK
eukprot:gene11937-8217_t